MRFFIAWVAVLTMLQVTPQRVHASEPLGRDTVWLLDNLDPDFVTPPFEDVLTVFDGSGQVLMTNVGSNHAQMIGGARVLAVEPEGRWTLVASEAAGLVRIGAAGEIDWTLPLVANSVALGADGYAYVLEAGETIYGVSLLRIDPVTGETSAVVKKAGFDVAVDSAHDRIWIVGKDVKALDIPTLDLEFATRWFGWAAVSVDYTTDGSAWVAERQYSAGAGQNRLLRVSAAGVVDNEIALDAAPSCVAVDRSDDSVWVTTFLGSAGAASLRKYAADGTPLVSVPDVDGWTVRVDTSNASAWVSERNGTVSHFAADGTLLDSFAGAIGDPQRDTWLELPFAEPIATACNDGQDNDQDGAIDYPADSGCTEPLGKSEDPSRDCADGIDNDGDGLVDGSDPGCAWSIDVSERSKLAMCDDGLDNDADGLVDYPADPSCSSPLDDTEVRPACGFGIELSFPLAALLGLRRRRRHAAWASSGGPWSGTGGRW